ncbi:MAG: ABC transporter permease [Bacteroidetes bacterium]|nr:ABC transporter permease [Bacteroidota bacterium]
MKTYFKLAWRNLWRNKRRSLITIASIFFGVFFAIFLSSIQKGSFENILENMVKFYSGYIQIQGEKYKDNKSLNQSFEDNDLLRGKVASETNVTHFASRIESFALSAFKDQTYAAVVLGIEPAQENQISEISKWISQGTYFTKSNEVNGVLIGSQLAENLGIGVNDTLVLIGQGYHGQTAAGKFPVLGLLKFPLPDLNKQMIYMSLESARNFYSMPDRSTSMVLMVDNVDKIDKTIDHLEQAIDKNLKVYSWKEIQPELENFIQGKLAGGKIMKGILFMVIGFGIWGTIIMLMAERKRELGIIIALGVRKIRVMRIIVLESFLIGFIGVVIGSITSLPLVSYLYLHPVHVSGSIKETYESMGFEPVLKFSIHPDNFISPAITVFILFTAITLYAVWYIARLKTASALRA